MNNPIKNARTVGRLLRTQGAGWLAFRAGYALQRRLGLLRRRLPATPWEGQPLSLATRDPMAARPDDYFAYRRDGAPPFFFAPAGVRDPDTLHRWDEVGPGPSDRADELGQGVFRYFGRTPVSVGWPPPWHENPFTGQRLTAARHWTRIGDFTGGDIKVIWEPSRFGFAYTLVRAYARTGDEAYPELFWRLVESWRAHNPPQQGPNWKCGQEVSLRVMAWCFGLYGFGGSPATTPERVAALAQMIAVSGHRIESTLRYALSQRNNHGISEGVGLWTIGVLFPELRAAPRWAAAGRRVLEVLGHTLIYEDGAFAQHSLNYHRMMLHAYLWALRLGDIHGRPFSTSLRERVGRAGELLYQLQDEESGRVPCYGHHDGAMILPLDNCDDQDYRPVLQATRYLTTGSRLYPDGPWDEGLYWLFGPTAPKARVDRPRRDDLRAPIGGYHTMRSSTGFAFIRCATFRHRPAQADMLHLDLWWRGQNITLDPGTYSYNAPAPWDNALAHTSPHNTVAVDDLDQMDRAGKFLWLPWLKGTEGFRRESAGRHLAYWEGSHDGYARLSPPVVHRRAIVRLAGEHWLVLDQLDSRGMHRYRLHWLLPDWPHHRAAGSVPPDADDSGAYVVLESAAGPFGVRIGVLAASGNCSLVRAEPNGVRGWRSPYYMHREPALSLDLNCRATSARFWTVLGPAGFSVSASTDGLSIDGPSWSARVELGGIPDGSIPAGSDEDTPIVTRVHLTGTPDDLLEMCR